MTTRSSPATDERSPKGRTSINGARRASTSSSRWASASRALLFACIAACGSSTSDGASGSSSGGVEGTTCVDHPSCNTGLYCLVVGESIEGHCEKLPASCSTADCACLDTALTATCSGKGRCTAEVGRAVYACPTTARKKEGEACTTSRGCEGGLYCHVSVVTRQGKCEKLPASCGGTATCDCLKADGCPGGTARKCAIFGDDVSEVCE